MFPKEIDYILGDFEMEKESEMNAVANKGNDDDEYFSPLGHHRDNGLEQIEFV